MYHQKFVSSDLALLRCDCNAVWRVWLGTDQSNEFVINDIRCHCGRRMRVDQEINLPMGKEYTQFPILDINTNDKKVVL